MRRRLTRRRLPLAVGMEITPLIDIVFLLLIFFMLTSSFVFQQGIKVHLPKTVTADVAQKENVVITVAQQGHLYLGSHVVTLQELRKKLSHAQQIHRPVLIRADRKAALGRVVEVWDLCRDLGFTQVNIATNQSS